MTLVTIGYYTGAGALTMLFMKNETIIDIGAKLLQGLCLCLPFLCMDFLAVGVFQACGLGKKAFLFAVLRKIILEIPALYILNFLFPLYGLAYAQPIAEFILAAASIIVIRKLFLNLKSSPQSMTPME